MKEWGQTAVTNLAVPLKHGVIMDATLWTEPYKECLSRHYLKKAEPLVSRSFKQTPLMPDIAQASGLDTFTHPHHTTRMRIRKKKKSH